MSASATARELDEHDQQRERFTLQTIIAASRSYAWARLEPYIRDGLDPFFMHGEIGIYGWAAAAYAADRAEIKRKYRGRQRRSKLRLINRRLNEFFDSLTVAQDEWEKRQKAA